MTAPNAPSVKHDAQHLAEQAGLRNGLRAAGLPILTTAAEDYARAWDALARENAIDRYLAGGDS